MKSVAVKITPETRCERIKCLAERRRRTQHWLMRHPTNCSAGSTIRKLAEAGSLLTTVF